jgi:hypothetical protein
MYFAEWLVQLHKYLVEANSRMVYDLSDIISDLNATRSARVNNLFDTMFVLQNFENSSAFMNSNKFQPYRVNTGDSKYPLSMVVTERPDYFEFRIEYSSAYFLAADVSVLTDMFKQLVTRIAQNMNSTIAEFIEEPESRTYLNDSDISFNF